MDMLSTDTDCYVRPSSALKIAQPPDKSKITSHILGDRLEEHPTLSSWKLIHPYCHIWQDCDAFTPAKDVRLHFLKRLS
jgi:hypothetical protein